MDKWMDCYSILQVHQNAEADIIEGTYKRLSKKYHPDVNRSPDAISRMQDINAAYSILKDEKKRAAYHLDWMRRNLPVQPAAGRSPFSPRTGGGAEIMPQNAEYDKALNVLARYFELLHMGKYQEAYKLICEMDKQKNSVLSFVNWRQSVAQVFELQKFSIVKDRYFEEFFAGGEGVRPAQRFRVVIEERNLQTGQVGASAHSKFTLKDGGEWKVFLGYGKLDESALKFQAMAQGSKEGAKIIGLTDIGEFRTRVEVEAYRSSRYKRPLVLGILSVDVNYEKNGSGFSQCLHALVGEAIGKRMRLTDGLAPLDANHFGIMLPETKRRNAVRVLDRLCRRFAREAEAQFDASVSMGYTLSEYRDGKPSVQFKSIYQKLGAKLEVGQ